MFGIPEMEKIVFHNGFIKRVVVADACIENLIIKLKVHFEKRCLRIVVGKTKSYFQY